MQHFFLFLIYLAKISALFSQTIENIELSNEPINRIKIALVTVGDPKNHSDQKTGNGAVINIFEIGKFDVTAREYCAFLNAVATTSDPYGLYNINMEIDTRIASICRHREQNHYTYSLISGRENLPIVFVNWYAAARFCNWLENNQLEGPEGPLTTEQGAYTLNGANDTFDNLKEIQNHNRHISVNTGAHWRLPTLDEWYKAAYYKGGGTEAGYWKYPTQSNTPPGNKIGNNPNEANYYTLGYYATPHAWYGYYFADGAPYLTTVGAFSGSPGTYGTYDMGGNVWQWNDSFNLIEKWIANGVEVGSVLVGGHNITGGAWVSNAGIPFDRGYFDSLKGLEINGLDSVKANSYFFQQICSDATISFRVVHTLENNCPTSNNTEDQ